MKRSREPEDPADRSLSAAGAGDDDTSDFHDGRSPAKFAELDPDAAAAANSSTASAPASPIVMRCHFPPHRDALVFRTYDAYEAHYATAHTHRCAECVRNFPSDHLLLLHIEECHDPLVAVRRDKGERTFSCFVEDCERKCRTPQKRRLHLIDKHQFPKNYFFAVTKAGIDGRRSLLTDSHHRHSHHHNHGRRRSSGEPATTGAAVAATPGGGDAAQLRGEENEGVSPAVSEADMAEGEVAPLAGTDEASAMEEDPKPQAEGENPSSAAIEPPHAKPAPAETPTATDDRPDTAMEDLAGAMSSLRFVPPSIRFGRGRGRSGFARR